MIIYIDLLILLNFMYDFIILYVVSKVLKRNVKIIRIIISSLVGEMSIFFLIFNFNYILLLFSKLILSLIINIVCFKYESVKYTLINLSYFYMLSIILAGFIYYLYLNNYNYILIMCLIPLIFIVYLIQNNLKYKYNNYYNLRINISDKHSINCVGYLDTGNNVVDNISLKPVIIIKESKLNYKYKNYYYVPIKVLNNNTLIKCIKIKNIVINNKVINNVVLGISNDDLNIDGVDVLLNNKLRKEIINEKIN